MKANKLCSLLLAIIIVVSAGAPASASVEDTSFSDVDASAWYASAVAYCRDNDIVSGTSSTTFSPQMTMSRAMFTTILWRIAGNPETAVNQTFADVDSNQWYSSAIDWAAYEGIAIDFGSRAFNPDAPVTREEMATLLYRYAEYKGIGMDESVQIRFVDSQSISNWALTAVAWAQGAGIITGKPGNLFDPQGSATRAEVVVILHRFLTTNLFESDNETSVVAEHGADESNILIAYFSHTGNTQTLAQYIHEITGGDLFEIVTVNPYPADYNECLAVARRELQGDYRLALAAQVENMAKYDVVFIGHPIWHGHTPMAIRSFLEAYDFSGKIILPFCTSGSSGNSQAMATIRDMCPNSTVLDGLSITRAMLPDARNLAEAWLDGMNIGNTSAWTDGMTTDNAAAQENIINIQVGDTVLTATLVDNSSSEALKDLLASGSVTIDMRDYGNMEKVGSLGVNLPTNDERISTEPGDLILYQGNSVVIYYEPHSWSFTRLGKINDITQAELKEVLGSGNVTITLSLPVPVIP